MRRPASSSNWLSKHQRNEARSGLRLVESTEQKRRSVAYQNPFVPDIERFFEEACVVDGEAHEGARELYEAYRTWCAVRHRPLGSVTIFGRTLRQSGFQLHKSNINRWVGVRLK